MKQFQLVVWANNPNGANSPAAGAGAEAAGNTAEKGNSPNNPNNAPGYMSILFDFLSPRLLGLLGLLYIYLIYIDSYVKNLHRDIKSALGLLACGAVQEAAHG